LLNFGLLIADEEQVEPKEDSLTGYMLYPTEIQFIKITDRVEGVVGLRFGIEYYIEGYSNQKYEDVIFYSRIFHPILTNPKTGKSSRLTQERKLNYLNEINFDYFCFENEWEIQKGCWTFQIVENEVIKLEKSFEIL
jgi:hypothetical protein